MDLGQPGKTEGYVPLEDEGAQLQTRGGGDGPISMVVEMVPLKGGR